MSLVVSGLHKTGLLVDFKGLAMGNVRPGDNEYFSWPDNCQKGLDCHGMHNFQYLIPRLCFSTQLSQLGTASLLTSRRNVSQYFGASKFVDPPSLYRDGF